jgi:ferric-dicitrate binding protein FerR (iron transport regulator)
MKDISPELIQKYLSGNCTHEEEGRVLNWYNSFESRADQYVQLSNDEQQALKNRMLGNIELNIVNLTPRKNYTAVKRMVAIIGSAAAILLIIFAGIKFRNNNPSAVTGEAQVEQVVVTNKTKSIYKQVLPDRSIVWLSPGAEIKFKKPFIKRTLSLTGESFFEVTKDKQHPFTILSGDIVTKVWGTSYC